MKWLFVTLSLLACVAFSAVRMSPVKQYRRTYEDSLQAQRDKYLNEIRKAIAGKENDLVDSVFHNLKVLGGFPAANLLLAMNSWSRALGVGCQHCHDPRDWSLDSKPEKEIARQMSLMSTKINTDFLAKIKGLKSDRPIINCTSCHNGKLKPALKIIDEHS
jgi:Photosynthetic reaction centre cytochrome C subunit